MIPLTIDLDSLDATEDLARRLAALLTTGDTLLIDGELGAGKTTTVRALAAALGVDESAVSSPTFVIVNEYAAADLHIAHLDAYRLAGEEPEELELLGWDRFAPRSLVLIEWGSRIEPLLEDMGVTSLARLHIQATGESSRRATLSLPDAWHDRPALADLRALATTQREPTTCRVTGLPVPADSPTWPFASERARMADLYGWFSESFKVSRPAKYSDLEETE